MTDAPKLTLKDVLVPLDSDVTFGAFEVSAPTLILGPIQILPDGTIYVDEAEAVSANQAAEEAWAVLMNFARLHNERIANSETIAAEAEQRGYANAMEAERKDADQRIADARRKVLMEAAAIIVERIAVCIAEEQRDGDGIGASCRLELELVQRRLTALIDKEPDPARAEGEADR